MSRCPRCFRRLPGLVERPGRAPRVPGWRVLGRLGAGGFAEVWEGEGEGGRVALKVARAAADPRVEREAEALASLGPPLTPELLGRALTEDGRPVLVLSLVAGDTLAQALGGRDEPPPFATARAWAEALAQVLGEVHARGLIHRDLKAENAILAAGGVRLLDFGLARGGPVDAGARLTVTGAAVGSLETMAPEQRRGELVGPAADVYALGAIVYEIVTLRPPFVGDRAEVEHGHLVLRPPPPSTIVASARPWDELVLACLAKIPGRRPTAAQALARIRALAEDVPTPAPGRGDARSASGPRARPEAPRSHPSREPVVLVDLETGALLSDILEAIAPGFLLTERPGGALVAFTGEGGAPIDTARAAAESIVSRWGGRAVVHVAEVQVRRRGGGSSGFAGRGGEAPLIDAPPRVYGRAVDQPEGWRPGGAWDGVVLTEAAARAAPIGPAQPPRLIGRELAMARARGALAAGGAARLALLGEGGLGKSRLAREIAQLASARWGEAASCVLAASRGVPLAAAVAARLERRPLALIVDDADVADDAALSLLEDALGEGHGPLLVVLAADPALAVARPTLCPSEDRIDLGPLSRADAVELARVLLEPADYVPAEVLARLAEWCAGSPAALVGVVRALREEGIVRRRPGATGWYVATAELDRLPAAPAAHWLAARRLAALPPELAACLRVAALLGPEIRRDALEAALAAAGSPLDADAGLDELSRRGLIAAAAPGRFAFVDRLLARGVADSIPAAEAASVHRRVLPLFRGRVDALEPLAHHAAAAGEHGEAAEARLALAEHAAAAHHPVEADRHATAALASVLPGDWRGRLRALRLRGAARTILGRPRDAIDDLRAARRHAEALGDRDAVVALLVDEATALDWCEDFTGSARAVDEAIERGGDRESPPLLYGRGRAALRAGELANALALLGRAADEARDHETRAAALNALAAALVLGGRNDEAESRFRHVMAECEAAGDLRNLCTAYANRVILWTARGLPEPAEDDLRRTLALAREIGSPLAERAATHNLAELLFAGGDDVESLRLARRAAELETQLVERAMPENTVLLARIYAARGELHEARRCLSMVAPSPTVRLLTTALALLLSHDGGAAPAWDALLAEATPVDEGAAPEERVEILIWRALAASRHGRPEEAAQARREAAEAARAWPIWAGRVSRLSPDEPRN